MNRSPRLGAVLALSMTALAGCKAVGPDFQPPAPPKTAAYLAPGDTSSDLVRMTPDARVAGAWWKSFRSADLDRVMETALRGNPRGNSVTHGVTQGVAAAFRLPGDNVTWRMRRPARWAAAACGS